MDFATLWCERSGEEKWLVAKMSADNFLTTNKNGPTLLV